MHVIGTAGHVDHGKSTLVAALTGINPDRLKEEQEREMTIDLGFAWLTLPKSGQVGIVDVPGHQDFIENMLAGAGGIDAVLLVVAADEGIMPQTREHLAILDLLQVKAALIVITKIDLVDDPVWLAMVESEVRQAIVSTSLAGAPLVPVSAHTRAGLDDLIQAMDNLLSDQPSRLDLGRPRLPVDRAFTMRGFGTVVTGTLLDGALNQGDEVVLLPEGLPVRIRGLQSYKHKVEQALPGSRTAINLTGIDLSQVARGCVITRSGCYQPTSRLDVYVRVLADASLSLKHYDEVKVFIGTSSPLAHLRLLDAEAIPPGGSAWAQLDLSQPVVAAKEDRFIIRRPSPAETIGGGVVIDANPRDRHKRFSSRVIKQLELMRADSPRDIMVRTVLSLGPATRAETINASGLRPEEAATVIKQLIMDGQVVLIGEVNAGEHGNARVAGKDQADGWLIAARTWEEITRRCLDELQSFQKTHPLLRGMPKDELKSRLKLPTGLFLAYITEWNASAQIVVEDSTVKLPGFEVRYSSPQLAAIQRLMDSFNRSPHNPPAYKECLQELGEDLLTSLVDAGIMIRISTDVIYRREELNELLGKIRRLFDLQNQITLAQVRDQLSTSRKYAQALLEYLDRTGVTIREGDFRRLRR